MALLHNHLEQINLSAKFIGDLEFPSSRPFANALLHNQEITALIRDTEPHEQGLFSIDANLQNDLNPLSHRPRASEAATRQKTTQTSAVARVLGSDMLKKIQSSSRDSNRGRARAVDVDILLLGAEKLCAAYEVPGTLDRIAALRARHDQISSSIKLYEDKVAEQQSSCDRFNEDSSHDELLEGMDAENMTVMPPRPQEYTDEDLKMEEDAVKELEAKKKALEARVAGIERDLGGLRA